MPPSALLPALQPQAILEDQTDVAKKRRSGAKEVLALSTAELLKQLGKSGALEEGAGQTHAEGESLAKGEEDDSDTTESESEIEDARGRLRSLLGQQQAAPKVQSKPVKATKSSSSSNPAPKGSIKQEAPHKEVATKTVAKVSVPAPKKPKVVADAPMVLDGRGHRLQQPGPQLFCRSELYSACTVLGNLNLQCRTASGRVHLGQPLLQISNGLRPGSSRTASVADIGRHSACVSSGSLCANGLRPVSPEVAARLWAFGVEFLRQP